MYPVEDLPPTYTMNAKPGRGPLQSRGFGGLEDFGSSFVAQPGMRRISE